MSELELFDLAIIGSGPGGYHAALRAASYGAKVALIEKEKRLGGTCSNWGCIPTKALYSSAKLIADIRNKAEDFGIHIPCSLQLDFAKAVDRKNKVVQELTDGIVQLCKTKKVAVFKGFGSLVEGNIYTNFKVNIHQEDGINLVIAAKRVILATGSQPASIPAFHIDHNKILDSDDILRDTFKTIPKSLIIIGGGVIGCEFANIFAEFGTKITILEFLPTILANEEKMIVREMKKHLDSLGIVIMESKNVLSVETTATGVKATIIEATIPKEQQPTAEQQIIEADMCLVSIGRLKVTGNLGLEKFPINIVKGAIAINQETMETSFPGIYAIGDCTGIIMLAHFASYQGDIAVINALTSIGGFQGVHPEKANFNTVPATTFTHPNIGSIGLREKDAKEKYGEVFVGRFAYASSGKAKCMGEIEGFMMVIADARTDLIVGASCIGEAAPELISEIAVAMRLGLTAEQMAQVIHSHPTLSEIALEAVEDIHGMSIHKAAKRR